MVTTQLWHPSPAVLADSTTLFGDRVKGNTDEPWPGLSAGREFANYLTELTEDPEMRALYGDMQRGATIVQTWRQTRLLGAPMRHCLLIPEADDDTTQEISTRTVVSRSDLAQLVGQALSLRRRSVQVLIHDGLAGHSITALAVDQDTNSIIYHDQWPGDSLLAPGQNAAGVRAKRFGSVWRVSAAELERVAIAAFILPGVWATLRGQPGPPTFAQFRGTHFWSFFQIREVDRDAADANAVKITVSPGNWVDDIDMSLQCYDDGCIFFADLTLRQRWLTGPHWAMAKDLTTNWLSTLAPAADRDLINDLVGDVSALRLGDDLQTRLADPRWATSVAGQVTAAYLGLTERPFGIVYGMTSVTFARSRDPEGDPWTNVRMIFT
jgi:hypothetical protein